MDVVVVGSCMVDLISYAPRLPLSGETLHGTKFAVGFGGKGANQCVAARKLGCKCLLVARVGADSFGKDYRKALEELSIPVEHVPQTEHCSSGMAQIIVAESGQNQIVIVAGANDKLSTEDVRKAEDDIKNCRVLITQMEIPVPTTLEALRIKAASGKGISIFNAAPAQSSLDPELFSLPTIFCVNEVEAELLTGIHLSDPEQAERAVAALRERGCQHVIITMGADGAVYAAPASDPVHIPSIPVDAVDSTGAGDAFIGALAYYLSSEQYLPIPEAIRRACEVAAISVKRPGTQISFPTHYEIPSHLK